MRVQATNAACTVRRHRRRPGSSGTPGPRCWSSWPTGSGCRPSWIAGPTRARQAGRHTAAQVLSDLAVMLADGGDCLSDLAALRDQPGLFGPVASTPTAWRVVERLVRVASEGWPALRLARAQARRRAWQAGAWVDGLLVIDLDATLVTAHSDKQGARRDLQAGLRVSPAGGLAGPRGWHRRAAGRDPAARQRRGQHRRRPDRRGRPGARSAAQPGPGAAADPGPRRLRRRHPRVGRRPACAGRAASRSGSTWTAGSDRDPGAPSRGVAASHRRRRRRPGRRPGRRAGHPGPAGGGWPPGTRAICRRERPHPGAQLTLHRRRRAALPGLHHRPARPRHRQPGAAPPPACPRGGPHPRRQGHRRPQPAVRPVAAQRVWLELVLLALDLVCWAQALLLDGDLRRGRAQDPAVPAVARRRPRSVRHARRVIVRLDRTWPWAADLVTAFARLRALPARC